MRDLRPPFLGSGGATIRQEVRNMLALLYPRAPGPFPAGAVPWVALAITAAVLISFVAFTWTLYRTRKQEAASAESGIPNVLPRAA
jgi:hypothetical protein